MISKICTIDDIPEIIEMYEEAKIWQNYHQPDKKFERWTDRIFIESKINDRQVKLSGTWDNGKLIALVIGTFWKTLPNWSLSGLITNKRTVNLNLRENGIAQATEHLLDIAENMGYYKFYTIVSERQYKNKRVMNVFPKYIPILREYLYVTETKVLPNEFTNFEIFNLLLKVRVGPTWENNPVYIRSATALETRRKL